MTFLDITEDRYYWFFVFLVGVLPILVILCLAFYRPDIAVIILSIYGLLWLIAALKFIRLFSWL
ncbi:MAG: hypothetical protein GXO43_07895 [Crenarchaeota archaeon]|nr:hypothetical protein [Thermoproteota archaeon]